MNNSHLTHTSSGEGGGGRSEATTGYFYSTITNDLLLVASLLSPPLLSVCNCTFWVMWALITPYRSAPLQTNSIGTVVYVLYLLVFSTCNPGPTFYKKLGLMLSVLVVVSSFAFFVAPNIDVLREGKESWEVQVRGWNGCLGWSEATALA